jgi:hypothetical protein
MKVMRLEGRDTFFEMEIATSEICIWMARDFSQSDLLDKRAPWLLEEPLDTLLWLIIDMIILSPV